jgi:hypothetical protein
MSKTILIWLLITLFAINQTAVVDLYLNMLEKLGHWSNR